MDLKKQPNNHHKNIPGNPSTPTSSKTKLIGIGGVSRSGKSTLANLLKDALQKHGNSVSILDQDLFVVDEKWLPRIKDRYDWEVPASIDWKVLLQKIAAAKAKYDFVIIEGLFAFYHPTIDKKYAMRIYIELEQSKFLSRRAQETRWGEEPEWYLQHVWESHFTYGLPKKSFEQISTDPKGQVQNLLTKILAETAHKD
jgi:uridine kinase